MTTNDMQKKSGHEFFLVLKRECKYGDIKTNSSTDQVPAHELIIKMENFRYGTEQNYDFVGFQSDDIPDNPIKTMPCFKDKNIDMADAKKFFNIN